ncbi:MAG: hypothetical protein PHP56_12305 [Smithellaceae bacterium]|jgi:hypothetical protein|nr:hypothetical protein [Smithellaceae bacterium]
MKHMKTIEVPAKTEEVIDHVTCDICKMKIDESDENQVHFTTFDVCGKCYDEKLVPALHSDWCIAPGGLVTPDLKKVFKTFCHGCIFVSCSQYEKYGYDFIRKANGNPNTKIIVVDDERFAEMTFDEKMRLATGR